MQSECMPWRTLARVQFSPSSALIITPWPIVPTRMVPLFAMAHLLTSSEPFRLSRARDYTPIAEAPRLCLRRPATGGRLMRLARYFARPPAESYLTSTLFRQILWRIEGVGNSTEHNSERRLQWRNDSDWPLFLGWAGVPMRSRRSRARQRTQGSMRSSPPR